MSKFIFVAAPFILTWAALPRAARAQDSPASQSSQPQQQESSSQSQQPDQPQQPALEKPGTAKPEPESEAPTKPTATNPAAAEANKPVDGTTSRTGEESIARVNNEIIPRSELQRAETSADEDARQECQGKCTPDQLKTDIEDRRKNALRDLIDQSLLVQRAKDMGINVEPEVIKR